MPPSMSDEDLVNALAQYLELEPLEKQALLERDGLLARCQLADRAARDEGDRSHTSSKWGDGRPNVSASSSRLRRGGFGRYSTFTLLTIATGRPGVAVSWPAVVVASSTSPSRLTWSTSAGIVDDHLLVADRRHGLHAARTRAAGDALVQIRRRPELALHRTRG